MPAMTPKDPIAELMKQFPNCPRNVTRDNAPVAMLIAVARMSHMNTEVEAMGNDDSTAHHIRQAMRDAIFAEVRARKNA
jgi:hypothetical protein